MLHDPRSTTSVHLDGPLNDHASMQAAIRHAIDSRRHWLFITDDPRGHDVLTSLRLVLTLQGERTSHAVFAFKILRLFTTIEVSLLIVPKSAMPLPEVRELCRGVGNRGPANADEDIIVLSNTDGMNIAFAIDQIRLGKAFAATKAEAN